MRRTITRAWKKRDRITYYGLRSLQEQFPTLAYPDLLPLWQSRVSLADHYIDDAIEGHMIPKPKELIVDQLEGTVAHLRLQKKRKIESGSDLASATDAGEKLLVSFAKAKSQAVPCRSRTDKLPEEVDDVTPTAPNQSSFLKAGFEGGMLKREVHKDLQREQLEKDELDKEDQADSIANKKGGTPKKSVPTDEVRIRKLASAYNCKLLERKAKLEGSKLRNRIAFEVLSEITLIYSWRFDLPMTPLESKFWFVMLGQTG